MGVYLKIIQIIPEFGFGGAEIMCENLSVELRRQGHEVYVVSLFNTESAITQRLCDNNVPVFYLNKKLGFDGKIIFKLVKLFKKIKPDVVHTHLYSLKYAVPACVIAGVKRRIHTVHNIAQKEATPTNRKINKIFYHYFNVVPVALSKEVKKTIEYTYKIKPDAIPVIFNGIDLNNCVKKRSYIPKNNRISVLHIGRFSEQKNHMGLVDAFCKAHEFMPNCELNLIGDGELKESVKQKVLEMNISNSVNFLGLQDNVYPFLNKADIFILPSNYEGIPITLIEAMGTGLPIIATKVGGVVDMLDNEQNALLIDKDTESIYRSLIRLFENQELREQLGKNAILKAEKFSIVYTAKKYVQLYELMFKE